MSYTSESILPKIVKLQQLREVVELLGYEKECDGLDIQNRKASYSWYDDVDYKSWSGIELNIYRKNSEIIVTTRSTSSRSYWDLKQQNKTLKLIRGLLGGYFITDAGRNRYWRPDGLPPTPLSSGCYLVRWRFHNALIKKVRTYLLYRKLEVNGVTAKEKSTGVIFVDEMNPRLLSNNFLITYVIAIWEDYFRSIFVAVFKYSNQRQAMLNKIRLSHSLLEEIVIEEQSVESAVAKELSFQRPSMIVKHFKSLDTELDIGGAMRKPYKRRKVSLFDSIEMLIEDRNAFVHTGEMKLDLYDNELQTIFADIVEAVNRVYETIGKHYSFVPIYQHIVSKKWK